jgi:hypothetical protein
VFTLMNRERTLCTGVFPTASLASEWSAAFLPELEMKPVELLTAGVVGDILTETDGWTWSADDDIAEILEEIGRVKES